MTSSAVSTAARVASEIPGLPLRTRLTVASLTPACFATSARLRATLQLYDNPLQSPAVGRRRATIPRRGDHEGPRRARARAARDDEGAVRRRAAVLPRA